MSTATYNHYLIGFIYNFFQCNLLLGFISVYHQFLGCITYVGKHQYCIGGNIVHAEITINIRDSSFGGIVFILNRNTG